MKDRGGNIDLDLPEPSDNYIWNSPPCFPYKAQVTATPRLSVGEGQQTGDLTSLEPDLCGVKEWSRGHSIRLSHRPMCNKIVPGWEVDHTGARSAQRGKWEHRLTLAVGVL